MTKRKPGKAPVKGKAKKAVVKPAAPADPSFEHGNRPIVGLWGVAKRDGHWFVETPDLLGNGTYAQFSIKLRTRVVGSGDCLTPGFKAALQAQIIADALNSARIGPDVCLGLGEKWTDAAPPSAPR